MASLRTWPSAVMPPLLTDSCSEGGRVENGAGRGMNDRPAPAAVVAAFQKVEENSAADAVEVAIAPNASAATSAIRP